MKMYDAALIVLIVIVSLCAVGGAISGYFWYQDNPVEEAAESVIKKETGIDVDLTPTSPETSNRKVAIA